MPRYIDAEQLIKSLLDKDFYPALVKRASENAPTEDVVPRSEVESLKAQVKRLKAYDEERDIQLHQRLVREAKQEVAREIFEEIEKLLDFYSYTQLIQGEVCPISYFDIHLAVDITELKKKYIG